MDEDLDYKVDMETYKPPKYNCKWCDHRPQGYAYSQKAREHIVKHHPEVTAAEMERHFVVTRYPHLDIDFIVQRYADRLETLVGLQYKGIFIKKYLKTLGLLRHYTVDLVLMQHIKPGMRTKEELRQAAEDNLIGKFRKASPEVRFRGYLNRDIAVLRRDNVPEEVIEVVKQLKLIKFIKKQLDKAMTPEESPEGEETDLPSSATAVESDPPGTNPAPTVTEA